MPAGADAPLTTGVSQAESVSKAQPVPGQLPAAQAQQASLTEQARAYSLSGTPQLQSPVQTQPQPPVTNAWMERLLQELSLDDEEDGDGPVGYDAVAQVSSAAARLAIPAANSFQQQSNQVHVSYYQQHPGTATKM